MRTYLLVSGDFTTWGGMDRANYELAWHLAERAGARVHLVSHEVAEPLSGHPRVRWHRVPRPLNRHALAEPLLAWEARRWARKLAADGARVVVNGGNCAWPDVNWIHAVHSAWDNRNAEAPLLFRLRASWLKSRHRKAERRALSTSSLVITNSQRARRDVIERAGIPAGRVHTVYYGIDGRVFRPPTPEERREARRRFNWPEDRPLAAYIGAMGYDRNKGFDLLFEAWRRLCRDPAVGWDVDLVAAGQGAEVGLWRSRAAAAGLGERISLLGFTREIPALLAVADVLVSPTHYEAYGLGVHEALCCGLPALVTRSAGVAERYPPELQGLLLDDPPRADDLIRRLKAWRQDMQGCRDRVRDFSTRLRRRTWEDMGREILGLMMEAG